MQRKLILIGLAIAMMGQAFAEIIQPPAPTGPFAVGTESRRMVDEKRPEAFTDAADDHRELMVQFWYPAEGTEGKETTTYLPANPQVRAAMFAQLMIPAKRVDEEIMPWRTKSVQGADVSMLKGKFPVVLFSHGFGGYRGQNLSQMEELASRGYVVVSIEHTFCASAVEFPDGRIVYFDDEFKQKPNPDREALDKRYDELARLWAADASFVIDQLEKINATKGDAFAGKLDLDKIGMFGHSFGGATSGEMCLKDARVKCGINMDGRPYGDSRVQGVKQPFMVLCMVRGAEPSPMLLAQAGITKEVYMAIVAQMMGEYENIMRTTPEGYMAQMTHVDHFNFSDFPYISELSPVRKMVVGDIDPVRGGKIINGYVVEFFGKYLKGESAPMLAESAKHEAEVTFSVYSK